MKLVVLILTTLMSVCFTGRAQTINLSGKDLSLKEVFKTIKKQTGILFFYDADLLHNAKPISVDWKNETVATALHEICEGSPFTWTLEDKTITLIKRPGTSPEITNLSTHPKRVRVKGILTDEQGEPISAVSVVRKGTNIGTASNNAGEFFIDADPRDVLVFSSVNYVGKELKVESSPMNVQMQLDKKPLEAMLVGGNLATTRRKAEAKL